MRAALYIFSLAIMLMACSCQTTTPESTTHEVTATYTTIPIEKIIAIEPDEFRIKISMHKDVVLSIDGNVLQFYLIANSGDGEAYIFKLKKLLRDDNDGPAKGSNHSVAKFCLTTRAANELKALKSLLKTEADQFKHVYISAHVRPSITSKNTLEKHGADMRILVKLNDNQNYFMLDCIPSQVK